MKKIYESPNTKWVTMTVQNVMQQASLIISDDTVEDQWSKEQMAGDDDYVTKRSVWEE